MTTALTGDFSKYPASIRGLFPHLAGETLQLREAWVVYAHLFMEKKEFTDIMAERLGGILGMFQNLLQDEMFLSIARLTDKDSCGQTNLSLWRLLVAIPEARDDNFAHNVLIAMDQIYESACNIRKHRHKRIGHFDLNISLGDAILPRVAFKEIRILLERIEAFLNVFSREFDDTTIRYDFISGHEITSKAESTVYKAHTYDIYESEGKIPKLEWRIRAHK